LHVENPLLEIIGHQGYVVLDGGLATTLEARGHDLNDDLWSARVLLEEPDAIRRVHRDFLDAGADCIVTASYQASLEGFARRGLDAGEAATLMRTWVDLALAARRFFLADAHDSDARVHPLVAASVGPYGAYLADGSEYRGQYDLDDAELRAFHSDRWRILSDSPADLLACETIPSLRETSVLLSLHAETPGRWAWFSFSCRDGAHLHDGSPIADAVRLCTGVPQIAAVGINCTAPRYIPSLIAEARRVTDLPLIAYPNSGEKYDAATKTWRTDSNNPSWVESVPSWLDAGARGIGGCCRVGPREIARTRRLLASSY
jgi:homocysteine S-methyltransferase